MNSSPNTTPWDQTPMSQQNQTKSSQKDVLSLLMSVTSIVAFLIAFSGGTKLVIDVFGAGIESSLSTLPARVIVVGVAYAVGWVTAVIAERVFKNKLVPIFVIPLMWGCLVALCLLYIIILLKPHDQDYTTLKYWAYLTMLAGALAALVGLHLIFEDQNLRKFSYLLLFISLIHLGWMVYRYVFTPADQTFLWRDLLLLFFMGGSGSLMLAHIGLLTPLRKEITSYIRRNKRVLDD